jgi:hypothetical protein
MRIQAQTMLSDSCRFPQLAENLEKQRRSVEAQWWLVDNSACAGKVGPAVNEDTFGGIKF